MNYSLFKWSRKTCSGHDSNAAILQASREYDCITTTLGEYSASYLK